MTDLESRMLRALERMKSLFASDPRGEYVIARYDGKPVSEGDKRIIENRVGRLSRDP